MSTFYAIFPGPTSSYGATADRPISRIVQAPDLTTANLNVQSGEALLNIANFVNSGDYKISWVSSAWTLVARTDLSTVVSWNKTSITANGTDSATMSGVPNPTTISIVVVSVSNLKQNRIPAPITVTDGSFTLTANATGTYQVTIVNNFPYKDYTQNITAS